jgi:hypothetical protein
MYEDAHDLSKLVAQGPVPGVKTYCIYGERPAAPGSAARLAAAAVVVVARRITKPAARSDAQASRMPDSNAAEPWGLNVMYACDCFCSDEAASQFLMAHAYMPQCICR